MTSENRTPIQSHSEAYFGELSENAVLTTHRILGAFGRDARSFDILHADLFDSRSPVALSALQALGGIGDPRSFSPVSRLFGHSDPDIVCAAIRTCAAISAPDTLPIVLKLSASRREEAVQLEIVRTLAALSPDSPEVHRLASSLLSSETVQPESRAAIREVLLRLRLREGADAALALAAQSEEAFSTLLKIAGTDEQLAHAALAACQATRARLSLPVRAGLIALAASLSTPPAQSLFFAFLADEDPLLRRECYRRIGTIASQVPHFDALGAALGKSAEKDPSLEAEALEAVDAMVHLLRSAVAPPPMPRVAALPSEIAALFEELRGGHEGDLDTSHETGRQIAHARDYVEFYFDEELKKTFLHSIKTGGSAAERLRCARALKESAVKLEMRHFEGYRILQELLADPTRSGIALFIRHLSLARTEKGRILARLRRCLSLARLAHSPEAAPLFASVLGWAREMKLYRLAERALFALHGVDPASALGACRECMSPPVTNRMLAIAAIELVIDTDLAAMEPVFINLLHENDRYIRLALLDALSAGGTPGESLVRAILQLFTVETDKEVASKLAELIGAKAGMGIAYALIDVYERLDEGKKALAVFTIHRIVQRSAPVSGNLVPEFLYRVLRSGSPAAIARVPAALLALGDDYAPRVLAEVLSRLDSADRVTLVRDLRDDLRPSVIAVIWSLLREEDSQLQDTLRSVLPLTSDPRARQLLVSMVRTLRIAAADAAADVEPVDEREVHFSTEKDIYRFERMHVRMSAVMFSDIQDYSSKARELSPLEITALLEEYEGILLPIADAHEGTLVKRMGDGHLFLFSEPMCAVLAAIRVQKALRRFNRFRPENMRVPARIGIHWGEVVEKGGDALGNAVNIAFRLQSAARGGSTCISQELFGKVGEWIHAIDLGLVSLKGLRDPQRAWEPTEIALGLPADLDPLKRSPHARPAVHAHGPTDMPIDASALEGMLDTFAKEYRRLLEICRRNARSDREAKLIEEEFERSWRTFQPLFSALDKGVVERGVGRPSP